MSLTVLAGCKSKDNAGENNAAQETKDTSEDIAAVAEEKIKLKIGAYSQEITEEIEGEDMTYTYYLLIQDGGKGFMLSQDDIIISWNENTIKGGDTEYSYEMKDANTVVLKNGDIESEFKYIGDKLPADVEEKMPFYLDGTKKIKNQDAADAFEYMLTADIIDFYDYNGDVGYSAEDEELDSLSAAYFELKDGTIPILLINTPNAIHAMGYAHILQYKDGRIYDVFGLDEIVAIYKEAGVVVATYTGGGYGVTNYNYYYVDENDDLIFGAHTAIMESEEYAEIYGDKFEDAYQIGTDFDNLKDVTKEEFNEWLKGLVGDEEPITDYKLRKVKEVF